MIPALVLAALCVVADAAAQPAPPAPLPPTTAPLPPTTAPQTPPAPPAAASQPSLSPSTVVQAVERWLPALAKAAQDLRAAEADVMVAAGAFDLMVKSDAIVDRGYYDNETLKVSAEQPLAPFGMNLYGGYRLGRGTYAPYDGKLQTLSDGEFAAGVSLPLLRDRAIDTRRTDQLLARAGVDIADAGLERVRLGAYREALIRYWDAVAAAEQWRIQQALLTLAEQRDQQLADTVALGQIPAVERTDNARAVRQRRAAVVAARRAFEQQAIELSLLFRDDTGAPRLVSAEELTMPPDDPLADPPTEQELLDVALLTRPELRALGARREQLAAVERLARNTQRPQLNLFSEAARDIGEGPESRTGSSLRAGVTFGWPVQRRRAIGQTIRATAALAGLDQERRFALDRVRADVQDGLSAWRAAQDGLVHVREELALARELEGLERDRFLLGDSTQFMVNLRELATADAALREVRAVIDRRKAQVTIEAASGRLLRTGPS